MSETKTVAVLGCGLVGAAMVRDLARDEAFAVVAADVHPSALEPLDNTARVTTRCLDLSSTRAIAELVSDVDVVIGALPGVLGLQTLRTVIETGKPCCDISFMPEDPRQLDGLAKERGVAVAVDCGVAPGLANMLIGAADEALDETDDVVFYVGGLPLKRYWPYEYKAPFSPADVLEEYTREARIVVDGRVVAKPALSDPELVDLPGVGTLEAFNTDGLRSLLDTIGARNMKEKTLRYPGHRALMQVLRETGLFSKEPIEVGDVRVRPLDVTSKLLFESWRLQPDEPELTVLVVRVDGTRQGRPCRLEYRLYDEHDPKTGEHSMARTTGYPCTIVARLLASGRFSRPGVHPPELLAKEPGIMEHVITELGHRGVRVETVEAAEGRAPSVVERC